MVSSDVVGPDALMSITSKHDVSLFMTRGQCVPSWVGFSFTTSFKAVADTLPPVGQFDVLAFGCTSGTVELGWDRLLAQLQEARPGLKYTSAATAAIAALRQLGSKRVALLTPYPFDTHQRFLSFLGQHGINVVADGTFDKQLDAEIGQLSSDSIMAAAQHLTHANSADALFVSCMATPVVPLIAELERRLGVPVVTSAQALSWDALRLAGYQTPILGFGQLLAAVR